MPGNDGKSPSPHGASGSADRSGEAVSRQPSVGHEKRDIGVRGIVIFMAIMVLGAVVIQAGLWIWLKGMMRKEPHGEARRLERPAQEALLLTEGYPKLQISPRSDWQAYLAGQDRILNSAGWVDRSNGIVRIPISEAMEIVATKGPPAWGAINPSVSPLELQRQRAVEQGGQAR